MQAAGVITFVKTPPTTLKTLAARLKWAREQRGFTQGQLATAAKLKSQGAIGMYETSDRANPRNIIGLADALGVYPRWLKDGQLPCWTSGEERKQEDDVLKGEAAAFTSEVLRMLSQTEPDKRERLYALWSAVHGMVQQGLPIKISVDEPVARKATHAVRQPRQAQPRGR
jgi:transcriptional regulator with XRE-family HTH domain